MYQWCGLKQSARNVFILTWSLAVVWVDDEETDDEELKASPCNFSQQREACWACPKKRVKWQGDGCPHDEHKPSEKQMIKNIITSKNNFGSTIAA